MQFPMASMPSAPYAPPQFGYQPWQPVRQASPSTSPYTLPAAPQPVLASQAAGIQPRLPAPIIRMQSPETEKPVPPARLVMPSPEALGLGAAPAPVAQPREVDLNTAFARLRQLGALGLHLDKLHSGGYRATFVLPGRQGTQEIEADGATEGAALATALERAENWVARK